MLTLSEQLLLLGLNDEKGSVVFSASTALPYGLAGAILLELFFMNRISIKDNKVKLQNADKTNNEILDDALKLIRSSKKQRDTKYWIQLFQSKLKKLQERLAEQLVAKKVLSREAHSFMWLINYNRYPTHNELPEQNVRERIKSIVLKRAEPTDEEVSLISLIKVCELTNEIFEKSERKKAKAQIEKIVAKQSVSSAISSTMDEIMTAIMVIIIASTVTTTVIT